MVVLLGVLSIPMSIKCTSQTLVNQTIYIVIFFVKFKMSTLDCKAKSLNIPGKFAITVDNVFTEEECKKLIALAEENNFRPALVNMGGWETRIKEQRDCDRWMTDDPALARNFFQRIKEYLPLEWERRPLSCLNERLRFLKYGPGQYFKPHYDGEYERDDHSEKSFVTVQIYLNGGDDLKGGETTFFRRRLSDTLKLQAESIAAVVPAPGKVLIFEHEILHEGSKIIDGTKYVIRTDVMYARRQSKKQK